MLWRILSFLLNEEPPRLGEQTATILFEFVYCLASSMKTLSMGQIISQAQLREAPMTALIHMPYESPQPP